MSQQYLTVSLARLAIVNRDIRVTMPPRFVFSHGVQNRVCLFANMLIQRHGHIWKPWRLVERVFKLLGPAPNIINTHHHSSLSIDGYIINRLQAAIGLIFKQVSQGETSPGYSTSIQVQNTQHAVRLINTFIHYINPVNSLTKSDQGRAGLRVNYFDRLVHRVLKRGIRIEQNMLRRTARQSVSALRPEYLQPAPFAPRRIPGSAADVSGDPNASRPQVNRSAESADRSMIRHRFDDAEKTAAVDVDQLTEQVVRAIDRRIIARRERLGRV